MPELVVVIVNTEALDLWNILEQWKNCVGLSIYRNKEPSPEETLL